MKILLLCTGRGTHRTKRLGWLTANGLEAIPDGHFYVNNDADEHTIVQSLPPCPVHTCGKHDRRHIDSWAQKHADAVAAGDTRLDISLFRD